MVSISCHVYTSCATGSKAPTYVSGPIVYNLLLELWRLSLGYSDVDGDPGEMEAQSSWMHSTISILDNLKSKVLPGIVRPAFKDVPTEADNLGLRECGN